VPILNALPLDTYVDNYIMLQLIEVICIDFELPNNLIKKLWLGQITFL